MKKETIRIALYAGPGVGKSLLSARLFSDLSISKPFGEMALVQEFAKILIYTGRSEDLKNQVLVTKGQADMMRPFVGGVDIIITDSPIELGLIYGEEKTREAVSEIITKETQDLKTVNFFIERISSSKYDVQGRIENEDEAKEKDREILKMLEDNNIPFIKIKNEYDIAAVICHMTEEIGIKREILLNISQECSQNLRELPLNKR